MHGRWIALVGIIASAMTGFTHFASAQENLLRLECSWTNTVDTKTLVNSGTSGSVLITVDPKGTLRKEGLGAIFQARITAEAIEAETEYQLGGPQVYRERININRYTGKIESWHLIGKEGLVHYGSCKKLAGPAF